MDIIFYPTCVKTKVYQIISLMCMTSWILFLCPSLNPTFHLWTMSTVDIYQTVYQQPSRVNPQPPVLNHSALLRLVLSWLTTVVGHVSFLSFLIHADRSSSQTEECLMTCQPPRHLSYWRHFPRNLPLWLPLLHYQPQFKLLCKAFL